MEQFALIEQLGLTEQLGVLEQLGVVEQSGLTELKFEFDFCSSTAFVVVVVVVDLYSFHENRNLMWTPKGKSSRHESWRHEKPQYEYKLRKHEKNPCRVTPHVVPVSAGSVCRWASRCRSGGPGGRH